MDVNRCFRLGVVAMALCLIQTPQILAQTAPQAVTLKNGTRYVGQTANVSGFSSKQPNPWNSDQVALVYDGMRRIFFYRWHAGNLSPLGNDHMLANPTEFNIPQKTYNGTTRVTAELSFGPFNEFGHRIVRARNGEGTDTFVQGITKITPYFCEVKTLANPDNNRLRNWTMPIATSTIDPNVIRTLLEAQIKDRKNPADYLSIVDFFRESQKYQVALNELAFISEKFPGMRDVIEEQQTVIRQAQARQWIREVNRHIDVGQPNLASARLRAFARGGIAGEILAEMATIQTELKKSQQRVQNVSNSLTAMLDSILADPAAANVQDDQIPMLKRFRSELANELSTDNVDRLDAVARFLSDTQMSDLQKLSLAISGWYLGSNNATENFAVSQSFDAVRQLVIEYLSNADKARRAVIIEELKKYEGGEPEYLARMIAQMAPPKRPNLTNVAPSTPLEFPFKIQGANANEEPLEFRYVVQLPPEYTPYRRYPCIVTLPTDRNLDRQLLMWCGTYNEKLGINVGQATRNGYITIGVDWVRPGQSRYRYSAIEHKTVMTAVRKSLQQFSIDTDRVFLTGHGIGAEAAYDIGISHPDHWAGVVGVSGKVDKYPKFYREHIHLQLPVYSVVGEKDYASITPSETTWTRWLRSKQFVNCTVIEYEGRSNEFFVEEIVEIFKWAAGHRRRLPDRSAMEFKMDIRRPWDNYFWFYELHGVPANKVVWPALYDTAYKNGFPSPITMEAKLNKQPNKIRIEPTQQGDAATVWLSPEFVDLEKKIHITGRGDFNDFVSPSREILLEDVRLRGDRQHPFWANLYCGEKKKWYPNRLPTRKTNR